MSKLYNQPVAIHLNNQGLPIGFVWNGADYTITDVLEEWRDTGCWWDGEGEKAFYHLRTISGEYELYQDLMQNTWHLYRIMD